MIRRLLAFLTVLVLLPVSLSLAEKETEAITGPVAKTLDELNSMLNSAESVTTMIDEPFYENVTDENVALEAMGSVMDRLGCDDTTMLILDTVRSTEDDLTVYTFRQQAGDLAVYGGVAKLIVDKTGRLSPLLLPYSRICRIRRTRCGRSRRKRRKRLSGSRRRRTTPGC